MFIYKDIVTGDEMFTNAYTMKLVDDAIFELEGKSLTESSGIDEKLLGGNASAEGGAEALLDSASTGIDIIMASNLKEIPMAKSEFKIFIKSYMDKIVKHLQANAPDRVPTFKAAANKFISKVIGSYKDWNLYMGCSCNPEGGIGFLNYREDQVTPYMVFFQDGFISEKQ